MTHSGRCYCGAIRHQVVGEPTSVHLWHCTECRLSSGAPMTAWAAFVENQLTVTQGTPKTINLSGAIIRSLCADCGMELFWRNAELLPGDVEVQSATLADPNELPPRANIQTPERIGWMKNAHKLPALSVAELVEKMKKRSVATDTEGK